MNSYIQDEQLGCLLKIIFSGQFQVKFFFFQMIFFEIFILGKSNTLYRHDLHLLFHNKSTARLSLQLNKIQFPQKFEKLMPK